MRLLRESSHTEEIMFALKHLYRGTVNPQDTAVSLPDQRGVVIAKGSAHELSRDYADYAKSSVKQEHDRRVEYLEKRARSLRAMRTWVWAVGGGVCGILTILWVYFAVKYYSDDQRNEMLAVWGGKLVDLSPSASAMNYARIALIGAVLVFCMFYSWAVRQQKLNRKQLASADQSDQEFVKQMGVLVLTGVPGGAWLTDFAGLFSPALRDELFVLHSDERLSELSLMVDRLGNRFLKDSVNRTDADIDRLIGKS